MRIFASAIYAILSLLLIATAPTLHAQEKEAEKAAEKAQPKFVGLWETRDGMMHMELQAGGKISMTSNEGMSIHGTWKEHPENKGIMVTMEMHGEKEEALMEVKFDGDDKATFTVDEEPQKFVRVKGELKEENLIGAWKGTENDKEMGTLSHYLTIMEKEGKGLTKILEVFHKKKIYYVAEYKFTWRTVGNRLIETYEPGTENESVTIYSVKFPEPGKASLTIIGLDDDSFDEERTEDINLPDAPKGYKKVTEDEYWEIMEKILEEQE